MMRMIFIKKIGKKGVTNVCCVLIKKKCNDICFLNMFFISLLSRWTIFTYSYIFNPKSHIHKAIFILYLETLFMLIFDCVFLNERERGIHKKIGCKDSHC